MKTGDSRLGLDLSRVHLQWFADGDEGEATEETTDEEKNVEDDVAELKKQFNQLKKESSGKDRKVSELLEENKKLKDKSSKTKERERRKLELDDMTAEELKREIEHREEEIKAEYERELNEIKEQNKQNEFVQRIYKAAPQIENLLPHIIKLLTVPKDADEDTIKDYMQSAMDEINELVSKNRFVLDNKHKVSSRPQSGEVDATKIPTKKEWERMDEYTRRQWAKYATDEQMKKFTEQS